MPIHNLGYREWHDERESGRSRWLVVAEIGIRRAWQSTWLRRIAFVVWGPPVAYGILIFLFEQALTNNDAMPRNELANLLRVAMPSETYAAIADAMVAVPSAETQQRLMSVARPVFWKSVVLQLQRSQAVSMVLLVGLVAPPLISTDIRSRAFLLYFSRPLTRLQYIAGKFATVAAILVLTCTLPQLLLYVFAVLLSPDLSTISYTWDLPLEIIAGSAVMIAPTTLLALMLSSMTTESRFATFGWFTIWIFGFAAYSVMSSLGGDTTDVILRTSFLYLLFSDLSKAILDIPVLVSHTETQAAAVAAMTIICFTVIFRRVSAPLQA